MDNGGEKLKLQIRYFVKILHFKTRTNKTKKLEIKNKIINNIS